MWLSPTTGDSGERDKEAGYIRKKLRCVWGREEGWGEPVQSRLPLSEQEARHASGNKTRILPKSSSTSPVDYEYW